MVDQKLELEIQMLHKRICHALADPTRIMILYHLADKPLNVNELVDALKLPQSTISRHLGILRERNLVETEREGSSSINKLKDIRIIKALDLMRAILATQLADSIELAQSIMD